MKPILPARQIPPPTDYHAFNPDAWVPLTGDYVLCENPPGNFGIHFRCPCGCGRRDFIPIRPGPYSGNDRDPWGWNGDRERPTLKPSIFARQTCGWHGYLTNGIWEWA